MQFQYVDNNKRYYTLNYFYRNKFNTKISKISLDGNFTCPNIDGSKSFGGCIFCRAGSTSVSGELKFDLDEQFEHKKAMMDQKWENAKYIVYFQANTNTYDSVENLKKRFEPLLEKDDVVGLSLGTRDDAISEEVYDYLADLNKRTYLTIELGLQTINEKTTDFINRASTLKSFENAVKRLRALKIDVVVHIINGLPGETKVDMLANIHYLNKLGIQGIKIHNLFLEEGTRLAKIYKDHPFPMLSREEYVDIVCDQLEHLNPNIVVHRLTGDPDLEYLIEPKWVTKKFIVMNEIDKELVRRNTIQGFHSSVLNYAKHIWEEKLNPYDIVIDATAGNGHDSLYLAQIVIKGHVYAVDIQKEALLATDDRLKSHKIDNVSLHQMNHKDLRELTDKKIKLIHFNLGYLPTGDKTITTQWDSTRQAIDAAYSMLANNGLITIVVYPGHPEGQKESIALLDYLTSFKHWIYRNTEQENAPYLALIHKD